MTDESYKDWEKSIENSKNFNNGLLQDFEKWLKDKNLKPKTISSHVGNIDFYINNFLLRYDIIPAEKGALEIGSFLGDYFIRKTSWASKYTIQENIASFKKFYTYLNENKKVSDDELKEMKELIKDEKQYWIENVDDYWNNIDLDW